MRLYELLLGHQREGIAFPEMSDFDFFYNNSGDHLYYPKPSSMLSRLVKQYKLREGRAIDLGCGDGRNTFFLAEAGFCVIAVDLSCVAIKKIKRKKRDRNIKNIICLLSDVRTLDWAPSSYDLVVMSTLLDHLERNEIYDLVSRVKRWVKIGGYVYASVFTVDDPGFAVRIRGGRRPYVSPTADFVRTYFEYGELKSLFADFSIIYYKETFEEDLSHGPPHYHGIARLVCQK